MPLLDHLIVGDAGRRFSFRVAGTLGPQIADETADDTSPAITARDCQAALSPVKPLASLNAFGDGGLDMVGPNGLLEP